MGSKFQSRGSGHVFLRVPACFPEVWRVGEQLAFGPKPELCFYSVKIMPNKHTHGMLPAIFFPVSNAMTCEIINNYKSLQNVITVMGRKDFPRSFTVVAS